MFVMLLLGGIGNYLGPIIGSTLLLIILEILWTEILYLIFFGVIIMITVILMPEGIISSREHAVPYIVEEACLIT